ncbi:HAD-IA family hydrolase [Streptomyces sp. NPDC020983]|uniref:HAD-IA family hydrolase n=1 Tax=Streptomyces sp. NPDC020983 TaxID=3365106 RepID=UPI0037A460A7
MNDHRISVSPPSAPESAATSTAPAPVPSPAKDATPAARTAPTTHTAVPDLPPPARSAARAALLAWTPDAVVFDCDGTLMDTERNWQDARELTLADHGLRAAPGFAERAKGVHYTECGQLMAEEAGRPELADELTGALLDHFRALVATNAATMPGAAELVRRMAAFAPLAVASNCPADVVETCLSAAGLLSFFDHLVVPGSAVRPKPAPDVYLTAARLCGAAPERCLAVEDSACGIEAARSAGLRVLGVGPRPGNRVAADVDLWVDRLDDRDINGWAERRAARTHPH